MISLFILIRYESVIVAREEGRMLQEQLLKKQKKVIYDIIQLRYLLLLITYLYTIISLLVKYFVKIAVLYNLCIIVLIF